MPATVSSDANLTLVTFRLPEDTVKALDHEARSLGDSRTSVLRRAVHDWLQKREIPATEVR